MTARTVIAFEKQNGIDNVSDAFLVNPNRECSVTLAPESDKTGSNARVQVTVDDIEAILSGSALWVDSPVGEHREASGEKVFRPVTAVRLNVYAGTWQFQVRQS